MRYRIKITRFNSGKKDYTAQVKYIFWFTLNDCGQIFAREDEFQIGYTIFSTMEQAVDVCKKHFNAQIDKIEIRYPVF